MYYLDIVEKFKEFINKYTPYLEDIRRRLYMMSIFFIVFFAIGFFSTKYIIQSIIKLFEIEGVIIATTSPFQFADLSINIGLLSAFLIICPILILQIFLFLKPALSRREKGFFFLLIPLALILFILGFIYGFLILYYALAILAQINVQIGIKNIWDIGMFLSQIVITSTLLGVLFQFPIIFTYIIRMGIVSTSFLREKRRIAVFVIFIFTTLLPPTDGLSLLAMALPLILLYEVTIIVNSRIGRTKNHNLVS